MKTIGLLLLCGAALAFDESCLGEFTAAGAAKLYKMTDAVNATGARCLDGSPGAYYFQPGTGDGANKWYIHHQGGGWCESMENVR